MRAGYTEIKFVGNYIYNIVTNKKSVYVYTETKFVGNYIYNIVTNKKICICLYGNKICW